jgi:hypothetical protein
MITLKQRDIVSLITAALLILPTLLSGAMSLLAHTSDSATGWLWGGSDDGAGITTGLGWISMNNTNQGGSVLYGVDVPLSNGNLSGYAYSENMGYLAFDNSAGYLTGCPDGDCRAYREGNSLKGWARFVEIADAGTNAGGNTGWIHLSGVAQDGTSYGVSINTDGSFSGYAWSDEFGAIDFSPASAFTAPACSDTIDNDGDGWIDADDPGCYAGVRYDPADTDESNSGEDCSDGIDNDGDGLIDAADPECTNGWVDSEKPTPSFFLSGGSITIPAGDTTGSTSITLTPLNGYTKDVTMSYSVSPSPESGVSFDLSDSELTASEYTFGTKLTVTLTGNPGSAAKYTVRVKGKDNDSLSSFVDVAVDISDVINAGGGSTGPIDFDYSEF